jgi:MRG-binding protein
MPPRKRARGGANATVSTPTAAKSDDAMDVDTPQPSTPSKSAAAKTPVVDIHNDAWTDDQLSSLFKGVIRWKPAGMYTFLNPLCRSYSHSQYHAPNGPAREVRC